MILIVEYLLLIDSFALREITPELKKFLQQPRRNSRLFLWSGPDWDYTFWHKSVKQYIDKFNPYHIGNSSEDEYYFSDIYQKLIEPHFYN